MSRTIKDLMDDDDVADNDSIPLPMVSSEIMQKVMVFLQYKKDHPPPPKDPTFCPDCETEKEKDERLANEKKLTPWDLEFCNVEDKVLVEIMLAANFLNIDSLINMTCKAIAEIWSRLSVEEIRQRFQIQNDYTPAEEAKVREEIQWVNNK